MDKIVNGVSVLQWKVRFISAFNILKKIGTGVKTIDIY